MADIIKQLDAFSEKYDLWKLALSYGLTSLKNHFQDEPRECSDHFGEHTLEDIQFLRLKQQLTFNNGKEATFILQTFYSLVIEKGETNINYGYYSLDVDSNGEIIDDWLVFK